MRTLQEWSKLSSKELRALPRVDKTGDPRVSHGTVSGYTYWRCSCTVCVEYWQDRKQQDRETIAAQHHVVCDIMQEWCVKSGLTVTEISDEFRVSKRRVQRLVLKGDWAYGCADELVRFVEKAGVQV